MIENRTAAFDGDPHAVQLRFVEAPKFDLPDVRQNDVLRFRPDNVLASGRDNAVAIAQLGGQLQVPFGPSADEDAHIHAPIVLQHVQRFGEDVIYISIGHGADLSLAVYSAKGQIIDHTAKRRNVLTFG